MTKCDYPRHGVRSIERLLRDQDSTCKNSAIEFLYLETSMFGHFIARCSGHKIRPSDLIKNDNVIDEIQYIAGIIHGS